MASFLGQQLSMKPSTACTARRSAQPVVAATKVKAPAKKAPAKGSVAKNKWLNAESGYDSSKWYGPDRKLYLPGGLLDPSEVPEYLDGSLPGECVPCCPSPPCVAAARTSTPRPRFLNMARRLFEAPAARVCPPVRRESSG